jgi:hypothetical protein
MNMEDVYRNTTDRLNKLYSQKYKGLIAFTEFYNEQQMILLEFSNLIKESVHQKIDEDIEEAYLLRIESELQ